MSSLHKANWNRRAGGRAQVSIGMHAHPKMNGNGIMFIRYYGFAVCFSCIYCILGLIVARC